MPDRVTRQQKRAQAAHSCVSTLREQLEQDPDDSFNKSEKNIKKIISDYSKLAKRFPVLVHTCGLTMATAYVEAKEKKQGEKYLAHLNVIMNNEGHITIAEQSRTAELLQYQYLTHEATESATWLKRYSEALIEEEEE